jgi:very-short-patch-repair endonuclease
MASTRARELRRRSTDAERKLWQHLRDRQVGGAKFRRQVPIGPYIVDFVAIEHQLVIEVDGGQHAMADADLVRSRWLASQGYRVIRFWNNEVLANPEGVIDTIRRAMVKTRI